MAHTYTNLMYHGVFSTKHRLTLLTPQIVPELIRVVGGIIRNHDGRLLAMNGPADHVHLLAIFPPRRALADQFRDIKAVSSDWVHRRFPELGEFAWQTGYGCFSVSRSNADRVERYIANQEIHHRRQTFEEELIALLDRHGVEYDRRYVFD